MKTRPLGLVILSLLLVGVGFSFYLQVAHMFEIGLWEFQLIFEKLTQLNKLVMIGCLVNAMLLYNANLAGMILSPALIVLVTLNNLFVAKADLYYTTTETMWASLAFLLMHTTILFPSSRLALNNSKLRWWRIPKRHKISTPLSLEINRGILSGASFDISATGLFFTSPLSLFSHEVALRQTVKVRVKLFRGLYLHKKCQVVRITEKPNGSYPAGIGLQFHKSTLFDRLGIQALRAITS